jgi:hypothetical protein
MKFFTSPVILNLQSNYFLYEDRTVAAVRSFLFIPAPTKPASSSIGKGPGKPQWLMKEQED